MNGIPSNHRLLIIDDNPAIHGDFRKVLGEPPQSGAGMAEAEAAFFGDAPKLPTRVSFQLDFAAQGQEGLEKIIRARDTLAPFAVAFVDVRMPPGMDGIETTAKIWEAAPDTQIVICTAYSDYSWEEMIAKVGYSDKLVILKKPFDNIEVLQLASSLTEKWRLAQEARLKLEELERMVTARTAKLKQSLELLQQAVTNHRRTDQRLRNSEERFRLITDNAADLIIVVNAEGRPQYASPSVEWSLGFTSEEFLRGTLFTLIHADDRERSLSLFKSALDTGTDQMLEYRLQRRDGVSRRFEAHVSVSAEQVGKPANLVIVSRDITEREQAEKENARLALQLHRASEGDSGAALATVIISELGPRLETIREKVRFAREACHQLLPILRSQKNLLAAATAHKLTPEILATATAADRATDVDYLETEVPHALADCNDSVVSLLNLLSDLQHGDVD